MGRMTKKEMIIQSTISLVAKEGVHAASTAKIAKLAEVATGTLFHHFPTKQDLIAGVYMHIQEKKLQHIEACICDDFIDLQEKTRLFVEQVTHYWIEHTKEFEFTRQVFHSSWYTQEMEEAAIALHIQGRDMLAKAMDNGKIRTVDMDFLMPCLHAITLMVAERVLSVTEKNKKERYLQEGHNLLWNIIKP